MSSLTLAEVTLQGVSEAVGNDELLLVRQENIILNVRSLEGNAAHEMQSLLDALVRESDALDLGPDVESEVGDLTYRWDAFGRAL